MLCIFTHFEGVVGAGGVRTEVDKPPLTSQALKVKMELSESGKIWFGSKLQALKMHICFVREGI